MRACTHVRTPRLLPRAATFIIASDKFASIAPSRESHRAKCRFPETFREAEKPLLRARAPLSYAKLYDRGPFSRLIVKYRVPVDFQSKSDLRVAKTGDPESRAGRAECTRRMSREGSRERRAGRRRRGRGAGKRGAVCPAWRNVPHYRVNHALSAAPPLADEDARRLFSSASDDVAPRDRRRGSARPGRPAAFDGASAAGRRRSGMHRSALFLLHSRPASLSHSLSLSLSLSLALPSKHSGARGKGTTREEGALNSVTLGRRT